MGFILQISFPGIWFSSCITSQLTIHQKKDFNNRYLISDDKDIEYYTTMALCLISEHSISGFRL
jgi:hypothetical protein